MALQDVINATLEKLRYIAKTETVFGEPIAAGGVTLIPVSKVSIGFAAGGAGKEREDKSGAGTGGGVNVTPVAFIAVSADGNVQVHSISDGDLDIKKLLTKAPEAVKKVADLFRKPPSGGKGKDSDKASADDDIYDDPPESSPDKNDAAADNDPPPGVGSGTIAV